MPVETANTESTLTFESGVCHNVIYDEKGNCVATIHHNEAGDYDADDVAANIVKAFNSRTEIAKTLEYVLTIFDRDGIRPLRGYAFTDDDLDYIRAAIAVLR